MSKYVMVSEKSCRSGRVNFINDCNGISLYAYRTCSFYCVVADSSKRDVAVKWTLPMQAYLISISYFRC